MKPVIFYIIAAALSISSCTTYTYDSVVTPPMSNIPERYHPPGKPLKIAITEHLFFIDLARMLKQRGHTIKKIDVKEFNELVKSDEGKKYDLIMGLIDFEDKKYYQNQIWEIISLLTLGILPSYGQWGFTYEVALVLPRKNRSGKVGWVLKEKKWSTIFAPVINAISPPDRKYMVEYTLMQLKAAYFLETLVATN